MSKYPGRWLGVRVLLRGNYKTEEFFKMPWCDCVSLRASGSLEAHQDRSLVSDKGGYWEKAMVDNPDHVHHFLTERQRIGRFGTTEEIANAIAFLSSDLSSFSVGSIVPIDGGQGRGYFGQ